MNKSDVRSYIEQSESAIDDDPQMNEQNTRVRLIQPLIKLLGWDMLTEVDLDCSIQVGSDGRIIADYVFLLEDTPVLVTEAKACPLELTESNEDQLKSYMTLSSVNWGLLTNGRKFRILHRQNGDDPQQVSSFSIDQLTDNMETLRCLSKEFIETGEAETVIQSKKSKRQAIETLRDDKETVAENVMQAVTTDVDGLRVHEIEAESKEFIDYLAKSLESDEQGILGQDEFHQEHEEDDKYLVVLSNSNGQYRQLGGKFQYNAMENVIEYLIQDHDLLNEIEIPYVPRRKRALLNDEPTHPDGQEMKQVRELSDGTNLNYEIDKSSKQEYMEELANICGFRVYFGGHW